MLEKQGEVIQGVEECRVEWGVGGVGIKKRVGRGQITLISLPAPWSHRGALSWVEEGSTNPFMETF